VDQLAFPPGLSILQKKILEAAVEGRVTFQALLPLVDASSPPARHVGSCVKVDVHADYTLANRLGKTSIFAGVSNLFDKAPPYIYSASLANSDPSTYDFVGRYVYGRVQHKF
jgi:hypothetical protein